MSLLNPITSLLRRFVGKLQREDISCGDFDIAIKKGGAELFLPWEKIAGIKEILDHPQAHRQIVLKNGRVMDLSPHTEVEVLLQEARTRGISVAEEPGGPATPEQERARKK